MSAVKSGWSSCSTLQSRWGAAATAEQRKRLDELLVPLMQQQLHLEAQLRTVVEVLESHGLDHRLLKGPALANTVYADPLQRYFHDIDLLVRAEQLADVVRVLTRKPATDGGGTNCVRASTVASPSRSRCSTASAANSTSTARSFAECADSSSTSTTSGRRAARCRWPV